MGSLRAEVRRPKYVDTRDPSSILQLARLFFVDVRWRSLIFGLCSMAQDKSASERMEKIVSLCKRRGFIFQSSEIYGGLNGCWDYGPLGTELKAQSERFLVAADGTRARRCRGDGRFDPDESAGLGGERPRGNFQRPDGGLS